MRIEPEQVKAVCQKIRDWGYDIEQIQEDLVAEFDVHEQKLDDPRQNRMPGFRRSDPGTSKKGAFDAYPRSGSQRWKALMAVRSTYPRGATYEEVVKATGINGVWKRLSELKQGGWITARGQRRVSTGSEADIYYLTVKGSDALEKRGLK